MKYFVTFDHETFEVDLTPEGALVDGEPVDADLAHVQGTDVWSLLLDGASHRLVSHRDGAGEWSLHMGGRRLRAEAVDERTRTIRKMTGAGAGVLGPAPIRAPMPGLVVQVEVEVGDVVEVGRGMAIVEAMKMENELRAEGPGVVAAIHVDAGDTVEKDQILIELDAVEDTAGEGA